MAAECDQLQMMTIVTILYMCDWTDGLTPVFLSPRPCGGGGQLDGDIVWRHM